MVSVSVNLNHLLKAAGQSLENVSSGTRIQLHVLIEICWDRMVNKDQISSLARHFEVPVEALVCDVKDVTTDSRLLLVNRSC